MDSLTRVLVTNDYASSLQLALEIPLLDADTVEAFDGSRRCAVINPLWKRFPYAEFANTAIKIMEMACLCKENKINYGYESTGSNNDDVKRLEYRYPTWCNSQFLANESPLPQHMLWEFTCQDSNNPLDRFTCAILLWEKDFVICYNRRPISMPISNLSAPLATALFRRRKCHLMKKNPNLSFSNRARSYSSLHLLRLKLDWSKTDMKMTWRSNLRITPTWLLEFTKVAQRCRECLSL